LSCGAACLEAGGAEKLLDNLADGSVTSLPVAQAKARELVAAS